MAWTALSPLPSQRPLRKKTISPNYRTSDIFSHSPKDQITNEIPTISTKTQSPLPTTIISALSAATLTYPLTADAATGSAVSPAASAFAAYGHFLSILLIVGALTVERLTIKPAMSDEEENRLAIADTTLGIAGALLAYTGYIRAVTYGKGWDFYSHEPIFWLKITFVAIFGAVSFFPTTKIIQRSVARQQGKDVPPMSEALAARMTSLMNAELLMVLSIPLTATLMARGVGYMNDFPWPVGAGISGLALVGLGYKYINEALSWSDEETNVAIKE
eukprot:CAMPEP_0172515876 /NCGR_PEP_ID=MMETSP1066-20121228/271631_1 /TAXON_ID=671091 /ORGANISM="Coscinodiscus wailesii, Strain CCMP2513" /LENGTH=274 /DNA_ID=CAMNT_0013297113 /DNA_START=134 /DNA_END=958 /DNA_ORIENTATION=+